MYVIVMIVVLGSVDFFMQTMQEIYRIMEDAQEYLLRYVLLHLIELVASNGELPASTLEYYNDKVILPKSCEVCLNILLPSTSVSVSFEPPLCATRPGLVR